jgi:hypothetical protein
MRIHHKSSLAKAMLLVLLSGFPGPAAYAGEGHEGEEQSVVLRVPRPMRKLKLRIDGVEYTPRDEALTVPGDDRRKRMHVELLDGNHRTVFSGYRRSGGDALTDISGRSFSLGARAGGSFLMGADVDKLYASPSMNYTSLSAEWQPSLLGLGVSSSRFLSHGCVSAGPCGRFDIIASGVALIAEAAPFRSGPLFFQRLHLALQLGLSSVRTQFALSEKDLNISDKDVSAGRFASFEFRIPVVRIWIDLQHGWHQIPVELKTLNYRRTIRQDTHAIGVRYAF